MTYITENGERRTTVSVRLTAEELDRLDSLRDLIGRRKAEQARAEGLTNTARMWEDAETVRRKIKRSDVFRYLLDRIQ